MLSFLDPGWIRAADPGDFWLSASIIWALAFFSAFLAWRSFRRLQAVEDTPRSLIRSAAQGYVEFAGTGRLMPGEPILAPLTRRRCLWWSYRIEEYVGSGRNAHWSNIRNEVSGELFLVDDGTGQCVIDPDKAEVIPSAKDVWYGSSAIPEGGPGLSQGSGYRYTEERMHEDDPICALGYFHTQGPVSSADIDEEVRQQLVAWKQDQAWLIQHFDSNHDGQVDQQEWDAARQEARRLVLEQERENLKRPPVNVLSRPADGRDFILSALPRKKLEARLRLYVAAGLLCFFCAGALGTYALSVRLTHAPAAGIQIAP